MMRLAPRFLARYGGRPLTLSLCALLLAQTPARAQESQIEQQVAQAPDGAVRMTFAARDGICGDGDCVSTRGDHSSHWNHARSADIEWDNDCEPGPIRVVMEVANHIPVRIHAYVGGRWRTPRDGAQVTDLGVVSAPAAAAFLLSLARRLPASPGNDAIFPAALADSATIWPALAGLARDASRPSRTRETAVFWLGQAAADVSAGLDSIAEDSGVDRGVREQAVFALSQRPRDEGVPALIRIATSNRDPDLRRKALFWLGQSGDPRAVDLFERLLTAPR
jgi:hypothetical protein